MALDQAGFRWRNDDGSETSATWVTAQNCEMTGGTGATRRLRFSVDADGSDPASAQYVLTYSMGTAGPWATLGITPPSASATYTSGANNWVTPDWVSAVRAQVWGGGGAGGAVTSGTAARGGGGGAGYGEGTACAVTAGATYAVTVGTAGVSAASPQAKAGNSSFVFNSGTIIATGGSNSQNNTTVNAGGSATGGDKNYAGGAGGSSRATGTSGGGGGAAGTTGAGGAAALNTRGTTGAGGGTSASGRTTAGVGAAGVAFGGAGAGGVKASTSGTNLGGNGGAGGIILSWTPNPPFIIGTSANIAAGGTSLTSEQLSPDAVHPYGTGRITDDTNPLPAFDFGTENQRTELEFTIQSTAAALSGTQYFFRIETV